MKKTVLLAIALFFGVLFANGQITSQSSLFGGLGVGSANNYKADGLGFTWAFGYQKNIWNEKGKIRFVPSLNIGMYSNSGIRDASNAYFNSTSLKTDLHFDVLRIKSFSLFMGLGLIFNFSSGLKNPAYFTQASITLGATAGFRLNPMEKRVAYEFVLVSGGIETRRYFSEATVFQMRIVYKLLKTPTKDAAEKELN